MHVLVINTGSSTIRYRLFDMPAARSLVGATLENVTDYRRGMQQVIDALRTFGADAPDAIGHRIVHGGRKFARAVTIDDDVIGGIRDATPLAPLHNPAALACVEVCSDIWRGVPQVAVFDTAFHQTMPPAAHFYALPHTLCDEHGVRRYGFHGISHQYLVREAARLLRVPEAEVNLITLHLGNGASAAAIRGGISVDTSMGMTPLEGLIMGTRGGDIDPSIPGYLVRQTGWSLADVETMLNENSGLKGICGESDMRAVRRLAGQGDARAELALEMFVYRLRKYIGAYFAVLTDVHALVFSGGVGEHNPWLWHEVCSKLKFLGIELGQLNKEPDALPLDISSATSRVRVLVVATDEEREIARQAHEVLR